MLLLHFHPRALQLLRLLHSTPRRAMQGRESATDDRPTSFDEEKAILGQLEVGRFIERFKTIVGDQ